ncbi:unnamed protein product [Closterium sp. NIES-54]
MPAERTIEHRGACSVPIRTAGYEKTQLTVMLACTASGEKLRPWVWFKVKNMPNCEIPEENHLVMSHLRARSTTDVSEDMCLGGTMGDNTRLLGQAPKEEDNEVQAKGVREVAMASGLDVLYQETPNYRGAAAEADRMIEPRETARHA